MVRKPAVAGQFYPGTKEGLKGKIEECFEHELGPGPLKGKPGNSREIVGMVVPHAGYMYSGPIAAHGYKALFEDGVPETIIVIGPNHHGFGAELALSDEDFETPLGTVKVDVNLVKELQGDMVQIDDRAHANEHAVEVQMPFLQYISDDIRIVPICMLKQDLDTAKELGKKLAEVTKDIDTVMIASTDFSHYVLKEVAEKRDGKAIDMITANDTEGLYKAVVDEHISMCGFGPVMAMMHGSGCTSGELLKYATSGDISSMRDVVGYASIVCR